MGKFYIAGLIVAVAVAASCLVSGCVERRLTINTIPQGALVTLNDEEIGEAPVTVPFQWYGDYNVRISREGYETLQIHRKLKGPWYDYFPFDFFAQVANPTRIIDAYEWTFELTPKQYPARDELIRKSQDLKEQFDWTPPPPPK
jgi:hypothetical protein